MKLKKEIFDILIIGILLFSEHLSIVISNYNTHNNLLKSESSEQELQFNYDNIILNDSIPFSLEADSYSKKIGVNFTKINETRNFIENGDFNTSADQWSALNQTDITYKWNNNGPENVKCIDFNLTGINSTKLYKPMKNGIERFQNLTGWSLTQNISSNFVHSLSSFTYPIIDTTYSLIHSYNGSSGSAILNSSYRFYYNSSFSLLSANLSFWYKISNPENFLSDNILTVGVYLIFNSTNQYLPWKQTFNDNTVFDFKNCLLSNISNYFNQSGYYNITFFTIHNHLNNNPSTAYFDYIGLNFTWAVKEIIESTSVFWNQSINFNRNANIDGEINLAYYTTQKFTHINSSNVFLCVWINGHRNDFNSLKNSINNTWIKQSLTIDKNFIGSELIDVKIGLFFNTTTYIFPNETFSIYFDNVSLLISAYPNPAQICLRIFVPEINSYYLVNRSVGNQDYALITSQSIVWRAGTVYSLELIANSSLIIIDLTLTIYYYTNLEPLDDDDEESEEEEYVEVSVVFMVLILIVVFATVTFLTRLEKRVFMNEKYEYIKKLNIKRKDFKKREQVKPEAKKKKCIKCGRNINLTAKFCEHCGTVQ